MQQLVKLSLITCAMLIISCDYSSSNSPSTEEQPLHNSHGPHSSDKAHSYQKPGANIRLSHNYSGSSKVGETSGSLNKPQPLSFGDKIIDLPSEESGR